MQLERERELEIQIEIEFVFYIVRRWCALARARLTHNGIVVVVVPWPYTHTHHHQSWRITSRRYHFPRHKNNNSIFTPFSFLVCVCVCVTESHISFGTCNLGNIYRWESGGFVRNILTKKRTEENFCLRRKRIKFYFPSRITRNGSKTLNYVYWYKGT